MILVILAASIAAALVFQKIARAGWVPRSHIADLEMDLAAAISARDFCEGEWARTYRDLMQANATIGRLNARRAA